MAETLDIAVLRYATAIEHTFWIAVKSQIHVIRSLVMLRRVNYRTAINGFVFTALWLVIGAVVMWSPVPDALGIGGGFFAAWLVLFFLVLAGAGMILTVAAINAAFPPSEGRPPAEGRSATEDRLSAEGRSATQARALARRQPGAPSWAPPQSAGAPASPRTTTPHRER